MAQVPLAALAVAPVTVDVLPDAKYWLYARSAELKLLRDPGSRLALPPSAWYAYASQSRAFKSSCHHGWLLSRVICATVVER